jgi:hypothetical protein
MQATEAGDRRALERLTRAGVSIEPRGKAYLLNGSHQTLMMSSLKDVTQADIDLMTGLNKAPMRADFCTRRKCR